MVAGQLMERLRELRWAVRGEDWRKDRAGLDDVQIEAPRSRRGESYVH